MITTTTYVGVNEARSRFSDLVNQVCYGGKQVVVTSRGRPKVAIVTLRAAQDRRLSAETTPLRHKRQAALKKLDQNYQALQQETHGQLPDPVEILHQLRHERTQQLLGHLR
ncbi:MAG: type II toxin-antitoxin system Phd/YefM family antitoxin [Anaerolineae bacterium]|nr:type II toxin-antitoxin system Phd/YefM family antitoxin [Anaerolineae bacterium]